MFGCIVRFDRDFRDITDKPYNHDATEEMRSRWEAQCKIQMGMLES